MLLVSAGNVSSAAVQFSPLFVLEKTRIWVLSASCTPTKKNVPGATDRQNGPTRELAFHVKSTTPQAGALKGAPKVTASPVSVNEPVPIGSGPTSNPVRVKRPTRMVIRP